MNIEERIERLERQNRRLRNGLGVVVIAAITVGLVGFTAQQGIPDVVRARQFVVVDSRGDLLASFHSLNEKEPRLSFWDSAFLKKNPGGDRIREWAFFGVDHDGKTLSLRMNHQNGKSAVIVTTSEEGGAGLILTDAKSSGMIAMRAATDGQRISLTGSSKRAIRLTNGQLSHLTYISLSDENGIDRAVLGATSLTTTRTGTVEKRAPSSLILFDKDGKVLWKAP